uniref:U-scoloptoxin(11)-Sm7a n=1 Tax=Scolopendra morsitans TaxID=943129 RepID=TXB7A_SCOMO|nr:RecName: Full=U-scoloptoxin(11)-Sm7a; Short=U-SLPTX(11)-Sm7a; Flags: Precursor [Scolopendra morsitans]
MYLFLMINYFVLANSFDFQGYSMNARNEKSKQKRSSSETDYVCISNDYCAFLQKNTQNLYTLPICKCPGDNECPLTWDPDDGRTLIQGDIHFKFCSSAPVGLKQCGSDDIAYTAMWNKNLKTNTSEFTGEVFCECPKEVTHFLMKTKNEEGIEGQAYKCPKLQTCTSEEICVHIYNYTNNFFEIKYCKCPDGQSCPDELNSAAETDVKKERIRYGMKCK